MTPHAITTVPADYFFVISSVQNRLLKTSSIACCALLLMLLAENSCAAVTLAQHAPIGLPQPPTNYSMLGMQCLIAVWIFILGSCFGSFLNVVIYRLPAGMSLGKPKSRCPQCETPLAAKDNIPVFGWLLLKGKCRYCRLPIPVRYPLIETTCGLIFLVLLFCELLTGAANLPLRHPDHFHVHPGFWLVWFAKWDLSGLYLYHCLVADRGACHMHDRLRPACAAAKAELVWNRRCSDVRHGLARDQTRARLSVPGKYFSDRNRLSLG